MISLSNMNDQLLPILNILQIYGSFHIASYAAESTVYSITGVNNYVCSKAGYDAYRAIHSATRSTASSTIRTAIRPVAYSVAYSAANSAAYSVVKCIAKSA